jgi:MbtH protein
MEGQYVIVRNHNDEYSIWFSDAALPDGWEAVGEPGAKSECLLWIEDNWTGLQPAAPRVIVTGFEPGRRNGS